MEAVSNTADWEALRRAAAEWETLLGQLPPKITGNKDASSRQPPTLGLWTLIKDIRPQLRLMKLDEEKIEQCALIYEDSLQQASTEMQQAFELAWASLEGDSGSLNEGQAALARLHKERFLAETAFRQRIAIEMIESRHLAVTGSENAEWTEETRALMERVYQQHPKLEAHEKKLLAEVSGLSLRQISIWVSASSH